MLDLNHLRDAVKAEGGLSRRLFLAYGAALTAIPVVGARTEARARRPSFAADPFSLGVASGEPNHSGVVLWTRLAPRPLDPDGGLPPDPIAVSWEIARDEAMRDIVQRGETLATPQLAHSVHVEIDGLEPARPYWYRFHAGDATSPIGRAVTTPKPDALPDRLRFAFASCAHWEHGYYNAYNDMAQSPLDLVFHLGDYIYEYETKDAQVRKHAGPKLRTLAQYRVRHAQYKTDPMLQAAHRLCPWVVAWDDHEIENNWAGDISENKDMDPIAFLEQRANAFQAYYEAMPLRSHHVPHGPHMKIYRTIRYGRLATFQVLDTRQYRTDQPNDARRSDLNDEALSPKNTMLGARQAGWLKRALLRSQSTWNVLAQQVMMGMVDRAAQPGAPPAYSMDQWPGYAYERMKLIEFIADRRVPNPVVLTGDIHSSWVNDLRVDDRKPETPIVATEFVGTSISSGGNGPAQIDTLDAILAANPGVRLYDRRRGYVRCEITPQSWTSDYRVVDDIRTPHTPARTLQTFHVQSGQPGAQG